MRYAAVGFWLFGMTLTGLADEGLQGPVTGYVFDSRQATIRPIEGLPGSARLGAGLEVGQALAACEVSSPERLALCRAGEQGTWLMVAWAGGAVRTWEVAGLAGAAEKILFRADGRRAVVHFGSGEEANGRLVWLRDPATNGTVSTSQETGPGWQLLAIEPEGDRVLMTNGRDLWVVDPSIGSQRVASGLSVSAAVFSREGGVYFADKETGEIWKLPRAEMGSEAIRVMTPADGVAKPVAVAACEAADGEQVVMVDGTAAHVEVLRPHGQRWESLPVWGQPNRMATLGRDGLYLLNQPGQGPLLLFDCAARAVFFVPVD